MGHHEHRHLTPIGASPLVRRDERRLALVFTITLAYTVAEVAGGLVSGSLALLADAGHMMIDDLALGLALAASWYSRRPPRPDRTYGHQRAEILAALANGVALVVVCLFILREGIARLLSPRPVDAPLMAWVAAGGLLVNVAGALILQGSRQRLNVRAAFLHVLGDLLGSVGALAAAALIGWFGWLAADPVASLLIGAIILTSSSRLVLDSIHVLMEGVPAPWSTSEIQRALEDTPGVAEVHDLHVWGLGGGAPLLTAHLVTDHSVPPARVLRVATRTLRDRFGILHTTLQVEPPDFNIIIQGFSDPPPETPG